MLKNLSVAAALFPSLSFTGLKLYKAILFSRDGANYPSIPNLQNFINQKVTIYELEYYTGAHIKPKIVGWHNGVLLEDTNDYIKLVDEKGIKRTIKKEALATSLERSPKQPNNLLVIADNAIVESLAWDSLYSILNHSRSQEFQQIYLNKEVIISYFDNKKNKFSEKYRGIIKNFYEKSVEIELIDSEGATELMEFYYKNNLGHTTKLRFAETLTEAKEEQVYLELRDIGSLYNGTDQNGPEIFIDEFSPKNTQEMTQKVRAQQ